MRMIYVIAYVESISFIKPIMNEREEKRYGRVSDALIISQKTK